MQETKNIIALTIRPHLVPFLFNELEGEIKAVYNNKKVKLSKVAKSSLLGDLLHRFKNNAKHANTKRKVSGFSIFLSIDNSTLCFEGTVHEVEISKKEYTVLHLVEEDARFVNDWFHGLLLNAMVEFIKGFIAGSDDELLISKAIHCFMIQHNLYDTVIDPETLRREYYRAVKKNHSLSRYQKQRAINRTYAFEV